MSVISRHLLVTCTAIGLGFMAGQQAQAHGIESSLRYLDGQLELSSSFSTGEPVEGAAVRLLNADGTPGDELGQIGANGQLVLTLPNVVEGVWTCKSMAAPDIATIWNYRSARAASCWTKSCKRAPNPRCSSIWPGWGHLPCSDLCA